jgi:hypothetical protein
MALEPNNVPTATSSLLSSSLLLVGFRALPSIGTTFDTLLLLDDHAPILCK